MNTLKKLGFGIVAAGAVAQNSVFALGFGQNNVDQNLKGDQASADIAVQSLINRATMFLAILAVIYALWGGFQIMTAAGDDKKVGAGKNIIMHAVIGLVIIFLAWSLVSFVIKLLFGGTQ